MKFKIEENSIGQRLDVYVAEIMQINRNQAQNLIKKNCILFNKKSEKNSYKICKNDEIEILDAEEEKIEPQNIQLDIIYEDGSLLVINKPKNMLTHPTAHNTKNTLVNALLGYLGENLSDIGGKYRRGIVHRLDKNTAGLIIVAKTNSAHENLQEQIRHKTARRKYVAISLGNLDKKEGILDFPIAKNLGDTVKMFVPKNLDEGVAAITQYKVLESFNGADFIELELKTGRTHQIRVHMSHIKHPIFGDSLYGACGFRKFAKIKTLEQVLQSYFISFSHPETGENLEFELPEEKWDDDIKKVLKILRSETKWKIYI